MVFKFNSAKAVSYANNFSSKNNPFYKVFSNGEDCNFVSQCLLAGSDNVSDKDNWFYSSEKDFSSSWVDQNELLAYLLSSQKGPFGRFVNKNNVSVGDIVFLPETEQCGVGIVTKVVDDEAFFVIKKNKYEEKNIKNLQKNGIKILHILGVKK